MTKPTVLVLIGYYLPGHRGGGPVRSIANLVEALGDEINFKIISLDRDLADSKSYSSVSYDNWVPIGKASTQRVPPGVRGTIALLRIIYRERFDILYLNSFFSAQFSILPIAFNRWVGKKNSAILLAPRGEFSKGALQFKKTKKHSFLSVARLLRLYDIERLVFQASTDDEALDIRFVLGHDRHTEIAQPVTNTIARPRKPNPSIFTAIDLPTTLESDGDETRPKEIGSASIVFLSRLVPKKNLTAALTFVAQLRGQITFTIYGPQEDPRYWRQCQRLIEAMPPNVTVRYCGELEHHLVAPTLRRFHVFLFPTFGENYGHVIAEALAAGCLVATSDQTPWHGLEDAGAGWRIPLAEDRRFVDVLQSSVDMNSTEFEHRSRKARHFAATSRQSVDAVGQHRVLFERTMSMRYRSLEDQESRLS